MNTMAESSNSQAHSSVPLELSLRAVLEISQVINLELGQHGMLQLLAEKVHSLMGYDCAVILIDPDALLLTWAGYHGLSETYIRAMNEQHNNLRTPAMSQGATGRAFRSHRPEQVTDLEDSGVRLWRDQARQEGIATFIATPMVLRNRVLGFINCYTRRPHVYSDAEMDLLMIIANQAAIAVEAAELHEHERQRAAELEALNVRLAEQHGQLLEAERIHRQLTEVLLEDSGLDAVVGRIAQLVGHPVALYDTDLRQLAAARAPAPLDEFERACVANGRVPRAALSRPSAGELAERLRTSGRPVRFGPDDLVGAEYARCVAPVSTGRSILGYLEVIEAPGPLGGLASRAVEHGTTVLALELLKQRAVLQAEQQLRGGFLDDLLAGDFEDPEAIVRRAGYLGFDLASTYRVLVFGIDPEADEVKGRPERRTIDRMRRRLERQALASCKARFPGAAVTARGELVVVVWPDQGGGDAAAEEVARLIQAEANGRLGGLTVSVGVGSVCRRPADFAESFAEARYCLELLHRFGNAERTLAIEAIGLNRFLLHSRQDAQLLEFAHRRLDRLLAYDQRQGGQLLHTLGTYLRSGCSLTRTAEQLVLHVNTVQYRIRRAEQLTDLRLGSPEGLMELQLALLIASLSPRRFPHLATEPIAPSQELAADPEVGSRYTA